MAVTAGPAEAGPQQSGQTAGAAADRLAGTPHGLSVRPARPDDAGAAGEICYAAFKAVAEGHGFAPDFPSPAVTTGLVEHLISRTDIYSVTAELDGCIVGTNFLWEDGAVAGVGPISVDPAVQNRRIGRRLMEAVLDRARDKAIASVRLVQAAYHGRSLSLYARLGFDAREPLSVMQGPALHVSVEGRRVRGATPADLEAADALHDRIHGHTRACDLRAAVMQGTAAVVEHAGRIAGYTTGVGFLGHSVGEVTEDLQALIGAAPSFRGPGFLLPTRDAALLRWCLQHGLRIVQPMTLMTTGRYTPPRGAYLPSVLY